MFLISMRRRKMNVLRSLKTLGVTLGCLSCFLFVSLLKYNVKDQSHREYHGEHGAKTTGNHTWVDVQTCRNVVDQLNMTRRTLWSKGYKNPCFRHRYKVVQGGKESESVSFLQCLPYFFVAGFPKCGTTDLFDRMTGHPEFFRPSFKEIHWLTRYRFVPPRQLQQFQTFHRKYKTRGLDYGLRQYTRIFDNLALELVHLPHTDNITEKWIAQNGITGDFSPSTAWDNDIFSFLPENQHLAIPKYTSIDFVKEMNPCAKIIFLMRDPVNRLYSDYLFFPTPNQGPHDFHTKVLDSVSKYQDCFETRTIQDCVFDVIMNKAMPVRLRLGMYYIYLKEWLKRFPRDQLLFLRLEDYADKTAETLKEVFEFLQMSPLPDDRIKEIVQWSPANSRPTNAPTMLESTRELLKEFYKPFNTKLSGFLGDSKYFWSEK